MNTIISEQNISLGYSTRASGNMSLCHGDTRDALANRKRFLSVLGMDINYLVCGQQVHGTNIVCVSKADAGRGSISADNAFADTDALITDQKNIALAVFTADCLAVFLYDTQKPAIGLVHAGWRGTYARIVAKTVYAMQEKFGSDPKFMRAVFGPAIQGCCYQVGPEFKGYFPENTRESNGQFYFDIAGANKQQLIDAGFASDSVNNTGICTVCSNDEYFSYRKQASSCGRMMSAFMLK